MASKKPSTFCSVEPDFLKQYNDQTNAIKPRKTQANKNMVAICIDVPKLGLATVVVVELCSFGAVAVDP